MKTITMTATQRLNLRYVIRAQSPSTIDELETLADLLEKIDFPEADLEVLVKDMPNGGAFIMQDEAAKVPAKDVDLENAEIKALRKILEPHDRFRPTVADLVWLRPLRAALDKAKPPAPAS